MFMSEIACTRLADTPMRAMTKPTSEPPMTTAKIMVVCNMDSRATAQKSFRPIER